MSILKIAKKLNIGTGTVQKILKEHLITDDIAKIAELDLWLRVENNSKFVRGKSKVRSEIEDFLSSEYTLKKQYKDSWEYKLIVQYQTEKDLEGEVEAILEEMHSLADMRNCFIEYSLSWQEGKKSW